MAMKAFTAVLLGAFALSGSTCGKSTTEDPTKEKSGPDAPVVTLEGVDTSSLTEREKREFSSYVSEFLSPCPSVPVSIAECVKDKRDCSACLPAAKYVVRGVKDGMTREQVEGAYKNRFDPGKVKNVPIDGSPTKGSETAPITIVEFADFQCPSCAQLAPALDKLVDSRKDDVRLAYKFYVLGRFPNSEPAARAAIAAGKQGKFWEMHKKIFATAVLDQQALDRMAKDLGLDLARFHADMQANETTERIAKDKKLGEDLEIEGTPSLFINGRAYDGRQELKDWLDLELTMLGKAPSAAAAAPAAGADASAPAADAGASAPAGDAGGGAAAADAGGRAAASAPK